jgi:hypothetical protein
MLRAQQAILPKQVTRLLVDLQRRVVILFRYKNFIEQMKTTEYKLKSEKCKRCSEMIGPTMNFCSKCALPVDLDNEYTREMELENENRALREKLDQGMKPMREEMNQQFNRIMSLIRQNPQLAHIKPEALSTKKIDN